MGKNLQITVDDGPDQKPQVVGALARGRAPVGGRPVPGRMRSVPRLALLGERVEEPVEQRAVVGPEAAHLEAASGR